MKELSAPIAEGRTAEIYPWEDGYVLKLFRDWCPSDWVEYEARIARAIYAAGVPSPAAGEIVEINGRGGLVYERLDGITMLQDMNARPWMLFKYARRLAEMHVQIHRQSIPGIPAYKDRLHYDIRNTKHLDEDLRARALARLATLPDGQKLCHGDYHPANILITQRGPVVIDWMTACAGDPWTDVARTCLLLTVGPKGAGDLMSPMIKIAIALYYRTYRSRYHSLVPDRQKQVERWLPLIAAARLSEEIIPEREALIRTAKEGM